MTRKRIPVGWDVFHHSEYGWEIERDDGLTLFQSDEAALDFICKDADQARLAIERCLDILNQRLPNG